MLRKLSAHLMEAIKDTIKNIMQGWETKKIGLPKDELERLLKKVLSKKEREHTRFNYFRNGILSVNVDSSVWLYHLSLKKEGLLEKLSKKTSRVKDIRLRLGLIK